MAHELTAGSIRRIMNSEDVSTPVLQLLAFKAIPGGNITRYRVILSDSVIALQAGVASQITSIFENGEIDKFAIIQIEKYICNVAGDKKLLFIVAFKVLVSGKEVGARIGNPKNVSFSSTGESNSSTNAAATPAAASGASISYKENLPVSRSTADVKNSTSLYASNSSYSESTMNVHPISCLTPYQNKWTIRARVTSKPPVRTWSNSKGEGKLFSATLLDESGEIKATGFNDSVDRFFHLLEPNKVYYISKATLKTANKQYTSVKNEYEMIFNSETTIVPCETNVSNIPMLQFDFIPISQIESVEKDANIDVIGICKSYTDAQTIITRSTNKELIKREICLVDNTNTEVNLTIWGEEATNFDGSGNPVLAVKGCRVSDFGGRSLSLSNNSSFQINPDIREAHILKGWYDKEGCHISSQSISVRGGSGAGNFVSEWKTFAQVRAENLGVGDKQDYFTAKAIIVLVRKENCLYMSCPVPTCNKKVVDLDNGLYRCEKCNKEYTEFQWRLLLSMSIADFTENLWVTCFQESAEVILGTTAQQLGALKENNDDEFNQVIANANFKSFIFKLRIKMETFNEESKLKTIVISAMPIDCAVYIKKLLEDVKKLTSAV